MRVMPELTLIEETTQRASTLVQATLTLFQLHFDTGRDRARCVHVATGRITDPVAACLYEEAYTALMLPFPDVRAAASALSMAARREPECYGTTDAALREVLELALEDAVEDELTTAAQLENAESADTQNRS